MSGVSALSVMPKPCDGCSSGSSLVALLLAARLPSSSRSSSSTVSDSVFSCLSRSTFTGTVVPGLVVTTVADQLVAVLRPACR